MTTTHIGSHIVYGEIPERHRMRMEMYFKRYRGCTSKDYIKDGTLDIIFPFVAGPSLVAAIVIAGVLTNGWLLLTSLIPAVLVAIIAALYHWRGSRYFNDDHVICLGSETKHLTGHISGFSTPWNDFSEACMMYQKQTAKLPEGHFVEDVDFYAVAIDVFKVFLEKVSLAKVVDRFNMEGDFRELQELAGSMKQFSERCSKIVHKSNQAQQKEFIKSVGSSLDNLNANAQFKLSALGELDNPESKKHKPNFSDEGCDYLSVGEETSPRPGVVVKRIT